MSNEIPGLKNKISMKWATFQALRGLINHIEQNGPDKAKVSLFTAAGIAKGRLTKIVQNLDLNSILPNNPENNLQHTLNISGVIPSRKKIIQDYIQSHSIENLDITDTGDVIYLTDVELYPSGNMDTKIMIPQMIFFVDSIIGFSLEPSIQEP